jgi:hypothetical protein
MRPGENQSQFVDRSQFKGVNLQAAQTTPPAYQPLPESGDLEALPVAPQIIQTEVPQSQPSATPRSLFHFNKLAIVITSLILGLIVITGIVMLWSVGFKANQQAKQPASDYATKDIPLSDVTTNTLLGVTQASKLSINGELQVGSTFILTPTATPTTPKVGQIYYDKLTNEPYVYNGSRFLSLVDAPTVQSLAGATGSLTLGNGLQINGSQLALSAAVQQSIGARVTTLQGQSGDINLLAGNGIAVNGTTITNTGVTNITGTNGLSVTQSNGSVTLGLPQLLGTGDTPIFASVQLNSALGIDYGGTGLDAGQITGNAVMITELDGSGYKLITPTANNQCLITDGLDSNKIKFGSCTGSVSNGVNGITDGNNVTADGDVILKPASGSPLTVTANTTSHTITLGLTTEADRGLAITPNGLGLQTCSLATPILKWDGTKWACAADADTPDTNTIYTQGDGIDISAGDVISVSLQGVALSGGAGSGLQMNGSGANAGLALMSCPSTPNAVLKYDTTNGWYCDTDLQGSGDGQGITALGNYLLATDPNYNTTTKGAYATASTIYLQEASASGAGIVTTTNGQIFAGTKTFNAKVTLSATGTGLDVTHDATIGGALSVTNAISGGSFSTLGAISGGAISGSSLSTTGTLTVSSTSTFTGLITANGGITVGTGTTLKLPTACTVGQVLSTNLSGELECTADDTGGNVSYGTPAGDGNGTAYTKATIPIKRLATIDAAGSLNVSELGFAAGYLQYNGGAYALDLNNATTSTLTIKNSSVGQVANLNVTGGISTAGSLTTNAIQAPAVTGSNAIGSNLVIDAANGTGTGGSGSIVFRTAAPIVGSGGPVVGTFTRGTNPNANTLSFAHTVSAGSGRLLLVEVVVQSNGASVTSMNYGGQALTKLGSIGHTFNSDRVEMWYLVAPTVGPATLTTNLDSFRGIQVVAINITGANQVTPFGTPSMAQGSSTTASTSVTASNLDTVIDVVATDTVAPTAAGGQTAIWNNQQGVFGASSYKSGTGTVTSSWTIGSSNNWSMMSVPIQSSTSSTAANTLTEALRINNQGRVGINASTPGAQLHVATGTAATIGQILQGSASQTADLLQLQDSAGNINAAFSALGNQLTLGRIATTGTVTPGKLVLSDGTTGGFSLTLQTATLTANRTLTLPNIDGTLCTTATCATISGTPVNGQLTKFNGTTGQITNSNLAESGSGATTLTYTGNAVINAATGFNGNLLDLQLNGTSKLKVTEAGNTTISGTLGVAVSSPTAFRIQSAGGAETLLTADTSANQLKVGNSSVGAGTTTLLVLDSSTTVPTGVDGAMYFDTGTHSFQCYSNSTWNACSGGDAVGGDVYQANDNTFTGNNSFTGLTNTFGTSATTQTGVAINANSMVSGTALQVATNSNALTSGNLVKIDHTSTYGNTFSLSNTLLNASRSVSSTTLYSTIGKGNTSFGTNTQSVFAGTPDLNFTHTVPAGNSNRILFAMVGSCYDNVSVTYGGVPMTKYGTVGTGTLGAPCNTGGRLSFYYLLNPATGSNNVNAVSNADGSQYYGVIVSDWYNVNQTTPISGAATGNPANINVTTGQVGIDSYLGNAFGSFSPNSSGQNVLEPGGADGPFSMAAGYSLAPAAQMSWTTPNSTIWDHLAVRINPAPIPGTGTITGSLARLSSTCNGICNDSSSILTLQQSTASATGAVLNVQNAGSGSAVYVQQTTSPASGQALIFANNAASVASGNLIDLRVGGVSKFSVDVNGNITAANMPNVSDVALLTADNNFTGTTNSFNSNATVQHALAINLDNLTSGGAIEVSTTSNTLTSGILVDIKQASEYANNFSTTNTLLNVERSVGTGDILSTISQISTPSSGQSTNSANAFQQYFTFAHTVPNTGSNRVLFVALATCLNDMTVTYGGQSMTKYPTSGTNATGSSCNGNDVSGFGTVVYYYLINPPTGTNTVAVTTGSAGSQYAAAVAVAFQNVDQTLPINNAATGKVSTINVRSYEVGLDVYLGAAGGGSTPVPSGSQVSLGVETGGPFRMGASKTPSGQTGTISTMSWGTSNVWDHLAIRLNPAITQGSGSASGNLANISNKCSIGICVDSTTVLNVNQAVNSSSGVALNVQNAGTGYGLQVGGTSSIFTGQTNGYNAAAATLYVGKTTGGRSINAAGTIGASGADYAEWIPWSGPKPDQGSVVVYKGSTFVVSSLETAAIAGNDSVDTDNAILVSFAGQLPVKVTGVVHEGDMLISNGDGTARAVPAAQATLADYTNRVAIAWETSTDPGVKKILAAVGTSATGMVSATALQSTGSFDTLNVTGNALIGGDLTVAGLTSVQDIIINGHLITAGDSPQAIVGLAAGSTASVEIDGNDTSGTITITTGNTSLDSGSLADIVFNRSYAKVPRIIMSGQDDASVRAAVYPANKSLTGFRLHTASPLAPSTTYTFDYFISQ